MAKNNTYKIPLKMIDWYNRKHLVVELWETSRSIRPRVKETNQEAREKT